MILHGDCLAQLKTLDSDSIDSLVTDPPAGISFMGKSWDSDHGGRDEWIAWMASVMRECLRVMKPGAHGLVWALPRTSHWTATALEDAGFEIRDCVYHIFGQGFPKSLDVSKAIDKAAGATREVLKTIPDRWTGKSAALNFSTDRPQESVNITGAPATDSAKEWQGWGTALKPAVENWILIRKPCSERTVAANVLKWGCGALNIDGSRISVSEQDPNRRGDTGGYSSGDSKANTPNAPYNSTRAATLTQGRFPSHLILDEQAAFMLDEQSGTSKGGTYKKSGSRVGGGDGPSVGIAGTKNAPDNYGDSGGASRFFYCAKISSSERNAGLQGIESKGTAQFTAKGGLKCALCDHWKNSGNPCTCETPQFVQQQWNGVEKLNSHPTVKPQKLMRYLCNLITQPGGTVLDPFTGSGSTGVAAKSLGFNFIGIEREAEYCAIAEKRIEAVTA